MTPPTSAKPQSLEQRLDDSYGILTHKPTRGIQVHKFVTLDQILRDLTEAAAEIRRLHRIEERARAWIPVAKPGAMFTAGDVRAMLERILEGEPADERHAPAKEQQTC